MVVPSLVRHGDDVGDLHTDGSSVWMVVSMIAFAVFLLTIAWALLRPRRRAAKTAADMLMERYARGEVDDEEFARLLGDIRSGTNARRRTAREGGVGRTT